MSNAQLYCKFSFKNRTEISHLEEHHLTFNVFIIGLYTYSAIETNPEHRKQAIL